MSDQSFDDPDLPPEPPSLSLGPAQSGSLVLAESVEAAPQSTEGPTHAVGDLLNVGGAQYRLVRRLGAGGMGEVFLARKLGSGGFERDVALKTVLPALANHHRADSHLKSFVDEARLAALLHHSNICQVLDLQPIPWRGFIQVLEYIPGHSLKEVIATARKKKRLLTEAFACFVAAEVATALEYAHSAVDSNGSPLGIIHRDVTPHNVMISSSGAVKLLDFGIAFSSLENRENTTSFAVKGKDQYYAPEQLIGGALDGRTDQFALGLCLYEMLTLKRFFERASNDTDTQLHLRIAQLTPDSVSHSLASAPIDDSLKAILLHALEPKREERFAGCGEFGDALRVFSQRRGWLYTGVDAEKELKALIALDDAPDAEKTNPSGKRKYSTNPRRLPVQTLHFLPKAPAATKLESGEPSPPSGASAPSGATPAPQRKLEQQFFAADELSRSASVRGVDALEAEHEEPPSETARRLRLQLQEELHNPKASPKKVFLVPALALVGTLMVGITLVKFVVLPSSRSSAGAGAMEIVKTPEQLRAERESQQRAIDNSPNAELAQVPTASPPAALEVIAPEPAQSAAVPLSSSALLGAAARPKSKDSQAVDALLAQHYGGRPVVTPETPTGAVPMAPLGPRRRSLDTVMIDAAPTSPGGLGIRLPKGTVLSARLASPADASTPAPVNAVLSADVVLGGSVVIKKAPQSSARRHRASVSSSRVTPFTLAPMP